MSRTVLDASRQTIDLDASGVEPPGSGSVRIGDVIAGQYLVREVLGAGGMGTVYLAEDQALGREVAIKLVRDDLLARPGARQAFVGEARAMARVRHQNVVTIHAFGEHGANPYIVMEYVRGSSLEVQQRERQAALAEALPMLDALCLGVQAIHDAGALHRDLKPGNILIDRNGRLAVTDFGLSRPALAPFAAGRQLGFGTPAYMAPELARSEAIDPRLAPRIDVYALGVIAFELVTGRRLFEASDVASMLYEHAFTLPPRASEVLATVPPALDGPIARALAKSPAERTRSAEALRRELAAAAAAAREFPRGLRFLVADDEPNALSALCELLELTFPGVLVEHAKDTAAALAIVAHTPPDLVIADLHMPHGGGHRLTEALRRDDATASIPIIVVTGKGGALDWQELRAMGADRFLVKPIDFDALAAMIRTLLHASGVGRC
jgi:serine/threonine-protein kinase